MTVFPQRDFHLDAASPLIDMGGPLATDRDRSRSDMGAYGGTEFATPNLDRFARGAVVFEDPIAASTWTMPCIGFWIGRCRSGIQP